jgi:hypothetical protein
MNKKIKEKIADNHRKAGIPEIKGATSFEKAINRNRLKAGLPAKDFNKDDNQKNN